MQDAMLNLAKLRVIAFQATSAAARIMYAEAQVIPIYGVLQYR